jgi:hypothetical protein
MPHDQQIDKENVVFKHDGILLSHKEEWNYAFTSKWMEFHLIEVSQAQKT